MALASSEQHCGVVPRTALRTGSLCTARLLAAGLQAALWPFFGHLSLEKRFVSSSVLGPTDSFAPVKCRQWRMLPCVCM
jgi:hypothetical protein